jgi:hypothetical protein
MKPFVEFDMIPQGSLGSIQIAFFHAFQNLDMLVDRLDNEFSRIP